jgi:hypothetical protein
MTTSQCEFWVSSFEFRVLVLPADYFAVTLTALLVILSALLVILSALLVILSECEGSRGRRQFVM